MVLTAVSSDEVRDVVYLLTRDDDERDGRWSVAANAIPVKSGSDMVSFQLDRLVRGRLVMHSALSCILLTASAR